VLICAVCDKTFCSAKELYFHNRDMHQTMSQKANSRCNECHKTFMNTASLKKHKCSKYDCKECGKRFTSKGLFQKHTYAEHDITKQEHTCCDCGQAFAKLNNLMRHVERVHLKLKNISCVECEETFASETEMKKHLYGTHYYQYACTECEKRFSSSYSLKVHINKLHPKSEKNEPDLCHESSNSKGGLETPSVTSNSKKKLAQVSPMSDPCQSSRNELIQRRSERTKTKRQWTKRKDPEQQAKARRIDKRWMP
jgi:hypothetical protein